MVSPLPRPLNQNLRPSDRLQSLLAAKGRSNRAPDPPAVNQRPSQVRPLNAGSA